MRAGEAAERGARPEGATDGPRARGPLSAGRGGSGPALRRWGVFAAIVAAFCGYLLATGRSVAWGGLASLLAFYALFYHLGALVGGARSGESLAGSLLAGRTLPLWTATLTMTATWVGGGYIAGTAEQTYAAGLVWVQAPLGYALSLVLGGLFFAPKMRRGRFVTMLDPIDIRVGRRIAGLAALPALLGETFWSAAILTALGTTFGTVVGLDFDAAIVFSAAIAVAYTVAGGLWSVALTDVLQLAILFGGLLLVLPFAAGEVGGLTAAVEGYGERMGEKASLFPPLAGWRDPAWGAAYWQWWDFALVLVFGGIPWQVYFQRVLATEDEGKARWLSIGAGGLALLAAVPAALLGMIATSVDWEAAGASAPEPASLVLPYVFRYLAPAAVGAVGLGALAAAVMSSVDSSVLSASSLGTWNLYRRLLRPGASEAALRRVLRRGIVLVGAAATLMALRVESVYALWYLCADFVYVLLFPQLTCALFHPGYNRPAALAGFGLSLFLRLGGGDATLGLPSFLPYPGGSAGGATGGSGADAETGLLFPFRTTAMLAGLAAILLVGRLTRRLDPPVPLERLDPRPRPANAATGPA